MPDQWGRPTFNDGAQIAQGLMTVQNWQQQQQDRNVDKEAYSVAQTLANKGDISKFSDEAKYKGAKMAFDQRFSELRNQTQENLNSSSVMQEKMTKLNLNIQNAQQRLKDYRMARAMHDDKRAKEIAVQLNNENMYTGRYIQPGQDGYEVTNWDGKKDQFKDMPIEQVDQLLGAYFDKPQDEIMKWQLSAEQMRSQKNAEIISKAEPYFNEKTGQVIYKVPAGVWGPDGRPRGAFFVDDPLAQKELPPESAKGFKPFSVAKASQELNKKTVVNPKDIVTGQTANGQQQGLIMQSPSGQAQFQPVQGITGQGLQPEPIDPSKQKSAFELKVKQFNTVLMPFNKSGGGMLQKMPDGSLSINLTDEGTVALKEAMSLVERAQSNPQALTPQERQLAPYAQQAVQMYQNLAQESSQAYGLPVQNNASTGSIPAPPPGFVMD